MTESPDDLMAIYRYRAPGGDLGGLHDRAILAKYLTPSRLAVAGVDVSQRVTHMTRRELDARYPGMPRAQGAKA